MTTDELRAWWEELRTSVDREAENAKASQQALLELSATYRQLDDEARSAIDDLLAEWVLSSDEARRFDALALIWEHSIRVALPSLHELDRRLRRAQTPSAPFERAKVDRTIKRLLGESIG